jgi:thioredoxin 1
MIKALKIIALSLAVCSSAWALNAEPITQSKLTQLQDKKQLVLIDIFAPWCSDCTTQSKIIDNYLKQHPHSTLHVLKVDFDKDKKWVKAFHAPRQGTLILLKGKKQIWFSVGETSPEVIASALKKATGDQ